MGGPYKQRTLDEMSDDERRRRHIKVRSPKHSQVPNPTNRISVLFDEDTIADIHKLAKRFNQSRTEMVRDLVEWGILGVEQDGKDP